MHKLKVLRDNDVTISIPISLTSDSNNEDVNKMSECEHENETTDISWKLLYNTLKSKVLTWD